MKDPDVTSYAEDAPRPTLEYFQGQVSAIAVGRPWSATVTTIDTVASDGARIRVLTWHAWIGGHRSVCSSNIWQALAWLRDEPGERSAPEAGTAKDMAVVTAPFASAGR